MELRTFLNWRCQWWSVLVRGREEFLGSRSTEWRSVACGGRLIVTSFRGEGRWSAEDEFLERSLQGTSRTFALAIPLLSDERRRQVGLTYLLFRVADSIEDAERLRADGKIRLLSVFRQLLSDVAPNDGGEPATAVSSETEFSGLWPAGSAVEELMCAVPRLLSLYRHLPSDVTAIIRSSLFRTIDGMSAFLGSAADGDRQICLETTADLRLYCYSVAGIVGELLTDLFVHQHHVPTSVQRELRQLAVGFGEFLQLINILKDSEDDALGGRTFIPLGMSRADVFALADQSHAESVRYLSLLDEFEFPADIEAFCKFIFLLAEGSLSVLRSPGAGRKLSREDVQRILLQVRAGAERRTA